jgi:hypothetical protein
MSERNLAGHVAFRGSLIWPAHGQRRPTIAHHHTRTPVPYMLSSPPQASYMVLCIKHLFKIPLSHEPSLLPSTDPASS